jgi:hypothetical protein
MFFGAKTNSTDPNLFDNFSSFIYMMPFAFYFGLDCEMNDMIQV